MEGNMERGKRIEIKPTELNPDCNPLIEMLIEKCDRCEELFVDYDDTGICKKCLNKSKRETFER
jgi:formylmethanofuran dehydrogenase subunit E